MQLYQLAMELDERSPDVAERAEALGLGSVGPTSDLTPEQVATLRASYHKGEPAGPPIPDMGPFTRPTEPQEPAAKPPKAPRTASPRARKAVAVAAAVIGLGGAVAFFAMQATPAEERQRQLSEDLAAWNEAPPATVAPDVEAAVTYPSNVPRDLETLCTNWSKAAEEERSSPPIERSQRDFTEFRAWAADRSAWGDAMAEMIHAGPSDGVPDITDYRNVRARYYGILSQASDADLRALADGIGLHDLEDYDRDVAAARHDMDPYVLPHCGGG